MRRWLLAMLLVSLPVHAATIEASEPATAHALAVAETAQGMRGTTARVEARVMEGSGGVFVDTKPLSQTDMQGSARLAARVAADTVGLDWRDHDHLVTFRSQSAVVGGPSAGAVMALVLATALWSLEQEPWPIDGGVAVTGTINPDGTIGPVGGIPAKAEGAARAGLHTVAYPAGQEVTEQAGSTIDMSQHCQDLEIRCVPVASLADLIELATGHRLERPDPPRPATADLPQLESSVREQVVGLEERLEQVRARAGDAPAAAVADALDDASQQAAAARQDLDGGRYYLAATMAFRGLIQVRYADALLDLEAAPEASTVRQHVEACGEAAAALSVPERAEDWTALEALAAAQVRVEAAQRMHAQALDLLEQSSGAVGWQTALLESSFCIERAQTVAWWASLPELLPPGPAVEQPDEHALDAIDRAREMLSYALSVQGSAGGAQALLEEAVRHFNDGRYPAAMLQAVEAEAAASVALQAAGAGVPDVVLEEAFAGAARAVDRARQEGIEPVLSVSLVELASDRQGTDALRDLWTARGMALLGSHEVAPAPTVTDVRGPAAPVQLTLALVSGILVGAMAMLVVWAAVGRR